MGQDASATILALVPLSMEADMEALPAAVGAGLKRVTSSAEFMEACVETTYAVVLLPASDFELKQWWSIWGCVYSMERRPAILVYTIHGDFGMWSSLLDAGVYDLIVAPFTEEKLRLSFQEAASQRDKS
jgi:FixJ family two-component response regulator